MATPRGNATLSLRPFRTDRSQEMNAYVAELIAAERSAEFERETASARLICEARRGTGPGPAPSVRVARVVAAAAFVVALWLAVAP